MYANLYTSHTSPMIVGEENICPNIHEAVERAKQLDKKLKKENIRKS